VCVFMNRFLCVASAHLYGKVVGRIRLPSSAKFVGAFKIVIVRSELRIVESIDT